MSKHEPRKEQRVVCPFLLNMHGQTISCEGFTQGAKISTTFSSQKRYKSHVEKFCETWDYEDCPVSGMVIHAKYRQ